MTRALLTEREREVLAGEATDVEHPDKYRSNTRGRIRERLDRLEQDLEILEQHEPELAEQLREAICAGTENASIQDVLDEIQELRKEVKETGKV